MVELAVRLVFSLAIVVGLLLLTVKVGARKFRPRNGAAVRIVHRQALSRGSAVAVVEVGNRVLVLGTTEHQINVLAELEEGELEGPSVLSLVEDTLDPEVGPASQVVTLQEARPAQPLHIETEAPRTAPKRRAGSHAARPAPKRKLEQAPAPRAAKKRVETQPSPTGPLAGSILSPHTWRQALGAATGRAS